MNAAKLHNYRFMNFTKMLFLGFAALFVVSCTPSLKKFEKQMIPNPTNQEQIDKNRILDYIIKNELTEAQSTDSGIYYVIEESGEAGKPNVKSTITAHYEGSFLSGEIFDSSKDRGEPLQVELKELIEGWQQAVPMLGQGGKGKFIFPSHLAYGNKGTNSIPPREVLVFDIELIDYSK